jgi:hypothetical protein
MTILLYASTTKVNADKPGAYKNLFFKTASTTGMNDPDAHASTKMCVKGDYK